VTDSARTRGKRILSVSDAVPPVTRGDVAALPYQTQRSRPHISERPLWSCEKPSPVALSGIQRVFRLYSDSRQVNRLFRRSSNVPPTPFTVDEKRSLSFQRALPGWVDTMSCATAMLPITTDLPVFDIDQIGKVVDQGMPAIRSCNPRWAACFARCVHPEGPWVPGSTRTVRS